MLYFLLFLIIPLKSFAILNIECSTNFPCQEELKPKVEFWVKVFHDYTKNQAIFHDAEAPEVVYSVITSDTYCSQRKTGPIEQERQRIKRLLTGIQDKWTSQGNPSFTADEQVLVDAMRKSKNFEIDKASERIRCQNGIREQFEKALARYRYYKDDVVEVLKDSNLPEDIQYLPFVESSYNPLAYSKVGAAGLWQIMPHTARVLGLKINASIDERLDPIMATKAAARYFENSYQTMQQSSANNSNTTQSFLGPFVITSYNYGIAGMKKALDAHGSNFMDVLNNYKGKSFRVAVKNFYASFLAAKHLVTNESYYFQKIEPYQFPKHDILNVPKNISAMKFAQNFNLDIEDLRELNPVLTKRVWNGAQPIPQNFQLKIPSGNSADQISKNIAAMSSDEIEVKIKNYQVQRGDFPCTIARMFDVPCSELMAANGLTGRGMIRVGQVLSIPTKETKVASNNKKLESVPSTPKSSAKQKPSILVMDEPVKPAEQPAPIVEAPPAQVPAPAPQEPGKPTLVFPSETKQPTPQVAAIETPSSPAALPPPATTQPSTNVPDNQDWLLTFKSKGENPSYFVYVEAEETLGHYSDWIEGTTTQEIRNLNKLPFDRALTIGQKIILPIKNDDQKGLFEQKRIEYHQTLEEGFDDRYSVIAFTTYQVKKGDNEWMISNKLQIPMWLIKKYNPILVQKSMRVGDNLNIPLLKDNKQSEPAVPVQEVPPPAPVS